MEWNRILRSAWLYVVVGLVLSSCSKDDEVSLTVELPEGTEIAAEGGRISMEVSGSGAWIVSRSSTGWLSASLTTGRGKQTVNLIASANREYDPRICRVTITSKDDAGVSKVVEVSQKGFTKLVVSSSSLYCMPILNGVTKMGVESNTNWTVSTDTEWLHLSVNSGQGNKNVELTVDDNESDEERTGVLTVQTDNSECRVVKEVKVVQYGQSAFLYRQPSTAWGSNLTDVKNYMKDYGVLREEKHELVNLGKHKEMLVGHCFCGVNLTSAWVALTAEKNSADALEKFLQFYDYKYDGKVTDVYPRYLAADGKTLAVIASDADLGFVVSYYDYVNLFSEPVTSWNRAESIVKASVESRGYSVAGKGTIASEGLHYTVYNGRNVESGMAYYFNVANQLKMVRVLFEPSVAAYSQVCQFLEGTLYYERRGNTVSVQAYVSRDGKSAVYVVNDGSSICVEYIPYEDAVKSSRQQSRAASIEQYMRSHRLPLPEDLLRWKPCLPESEF